jgi:hypothetical protein
MVNTTGISGAAPIWARVMENGINMLKAALPHVHPTPDWWSAPSVQSPAPTFGITAQTSARKSSRSDQLPASKETTCGQKFRLTPDRLRASAACSDFAMRVGHQCHDKDAIAG